MVCMYLDMYLGVCICVYLCMYVRIFGCVRTTAHTLPFNPTAIALL